MLVYQRVSNWFFTKNQWGTTNQTGCGLTSRNVPAGDTAAPGAWSWRDRRQSTWPVMVGLALRMSGNLSWNHRLVSDFHRFPIPIARLSDAVNSVFLILEHWLGRHTLRPEFWRQWSCLLGAFGWILGPFQSTVPEPFRPPLAIRPMEAWLVCFCCPSANVWDETCWSPKNCGRQARLPKLTQKGNGFWWLMHFLLVWLWQSMICH